MKTRFLVISTLVLSVFALLWNGLIHLVVLKVADEAIESIHRPDMSEKMWISIIITVFIVLLYAINFLKWRKTGSVFETSKHSLFFAALMIVVVDLNQYLQYEIPFSLILKWSFFGVIEFVMYGVILSFLFKKLMTTGK
jgi:hypothetical protein